MPRKSPKETLLDEIMEITGTEIDEIDDSDMAAHTDFGIVVEVLDSSDVPENELNDFHETEPIKIESEEMLIKKYINGEVAFPDYYTTLESGDDDDNDDDNDNIVTNKEDIAEDSVYNNKRETVQKLLDSTNSTQMPQSCEGRRKTKRKTLSAALQGLMGEANLCVIRGKTDLAEKICLEIIRQNPLAPEPFFTLAEIYETKDPEKYLNFSTIAAHLDPGNRDQWIRIAEINIEKKNYHQARICYSKALKYLVKDYDIRLRKAQLLESMNEERDAMFTLLKAVSIFPPDKGDLCLETAKRVAKYFHELQKMNLALEAMHNAYKVVPHLFNTEDLNIYLELLMVNKKHNIVLEVLRDRSKVDVITEQVDNETIVVSCLIPNDMIPDFRIKLSVCLIHLKAYHLINYVVSNIIEYIPKDTGIEWFIDIAEALMIEQKYVETLELLAPLVDETINTPAYVWLKLAECFRALENYDEAIKAYYEVVERAPFCFEAKFTLSALLKQQGRHREAIKALEQDLDSDSINPRLLYESCLMLKAVGEIDQYIEIGYILLARNSLKFRSREEIIAASTGGNTYNPSALKSIVESRLDDESTDQKEFKYSGNDLSIEDEYTLYKDIAKAAFQLKKFGMLQKLCLAISTAKRFRSKYRETEKIVMLASFYNKDFLIAFNFLRDLLTKNYRNNVYWNLCNIIIQGNEDTRYARFLKRLFARTHIRSLLQIFLANYHMIAGSYKYALNIYVPIFKETEDPLVAMCIAVIFSQMASQKNVLRKPTAISQAIAFMMRYSELRMSPETEQEIFYNVGRLYHQASMLHLALEFYQKSLQVSHKIIKEHYNILSLREETAFNIHLIYKASGNFDMARKYLYKYIEV